jgi:hypothetical protein
MLGEKVLQTGVEKMLSDICVEGTFKDGFKTIRLSNPICSDYGNLELALSGSFLPIPNKELFEVIKFFSKLSFWPRPNLPKTELKHFDDIKAERRTSVLLSAQSFNILMI